MSLLVCLDCTAAFAVGLKLCPHCGSERHAEQGSAAVLGIQAGPAVDTEEGHNMPKITRHGGASVAGEEPAAADPEGGEEPSAGTSSETSSTKPSTTHETSEPGPRKRARKTASRSARATTQGSSAGSADGGPTDDTSETDSADE